MVFSPVCKKTAPHEEIAVPAKGTVSEVSISSCNHLCISIPMVFSVRTRLLTCQTCPLLQPMQRLGRLQAARGVDATIQKTVSTTPSAHAETLIQTGETVH